MRKGRKIILAAFSCLTIILSCVAGIAGGVVGSRLKIGESVADIAKSAVTTQQNVSVVNEESAIVDVAQKTSNSVVSIVISKNLPIYENYGYDPYGIYQQQDNSQSTGTSLQEVGEGSGFVVSADGMIITNKHVVSDESASYTAVFNDGKKLDAKVLARDTLLDIAFLKVDTTGLTPLTFGSSSELKVGQTVVAIGNALGQFSNTVNSGIVSGLQRNITASDQGTGLSEQLNNVIQTDASINLGNSGGPLLDIKGNVIGVNVAVAANAQNVGFAIPSDVVKDLLNRLSKDGKIVRPTLGVRYRIINQSLKDANSLPVDYGALVEKGQTADQLAVIPGSPADKAGIQENDIILEVDGTKIDENNTLTTLIQSHKINDVANLKILRKGQEMNIQVTLDSAK